jgi:hypothetical protein
MNLEKRLLLLLIGASLLALTGCNAPVTPTPQPTLDVAAIKQEILSTLVAQMTADAPKPTATLQATATLEPSPTANLPTFTPVVAGAATSTPLPTFTAAAVTTRYPTWTKTPYTDRVVLAFQSPGDGTIMAPGQDFDVKWTFRNSGFRPWTNEFYITFWGGLESRTFKTLMLPPIGIGEETTVVADFRAPTEPGNYVSYWRLYNDDKIVLMKFNFVFTVR